MEIKKYKTQKEFVQHFIKTASKNDNVSIISSVEYAESLIKEILKYFVEHDENYTLKNIDFSDGEISCYNKEYLIELSYGNELYVEPYYAKDHYLYTESDLVYYTREVSKEAIDWMDASIKLMIIFEDEEPNEVYTTYNDDSHIISQCWTSDGNYYSRSFMSLDFDQFRDVKKDWLAFADSMK